MSRGKWKKNQVTDKPASAAVEQVREEVAEVKTVEVPASGVHRFRGRGTSLVGGEMVAFSNGVYKTTSEKMANILSQRGFERA